MWSNNEIEVLLGKTLTSITGGKDADEIFFKTDDDKEYKMFHYQDCCESVYVEDVIGDIEDLIGSPITMAEEVSENDDGASESGTWTFYKLATINGYVTIRWYGSSNGYYSEAVSFNDITNDN
jgi:hypothetical protein